MPVSESRIHKCKIVTTDYDLCLTNRVPDTDYKFQAIPAPIHPPENISGYAAYYLAKNHDQATYRNNLHSNYHLSILRKLIELDNQFATNNDQLAYCLKYSPTLKFIQVTSHISDKILN